MTRLTRPIPHLLTLTGLIASGLLIAAYASSLAAHRQMAETVYHSTGWDAQVVGAAYDAIAAGETLPCPAYTQRTVKGRHGTYVLAAEMTRAEFSPLLNRPIPSCDEAHGEYLFTITTGTRDHPVIFQGEILIDMATAQAEPHKVLRPLHRPDHAIAFTATPEAP